MWFPDKMPCRITISLTGDRKLVIEKNEYEGFLTFPMLWDTIVNKFKRLCGPYTDKELQDEIISAVRNLDSIAIADLTVLLGKVHQKKIRKPTPGSVGEMTS
jgi:2-methylcitrate dehydratase